MLRGYEAINMICKGQLEGVEATVKFVAKFLK
jgi:hypothetical protein